MVTCNVNDEDFKQREALRAGGERLLEMIATGVDLKQILTALCLTIEEQRSGTLASVLLLNPDGVHLDIAAAPNLPAEWKQQMQKLPIGPCAGSCGTAAYRASLVIASDIMTDPLWDLPEHRACALKHGLRASWSSPVLSSQGKLLGTFCLYYREPRSPKPKDLERIGLATHWARLAIGRDRAAEALRRNEAYLTEAQKLTHTGSWAWKPGQDRRLHGYWSEEMFRIFGLDARNGLPSDDTFWQCIHPNDRDKVRQAVQTAVDRKSDYAVDYRIVLSEGKLKYIQAIGHPVLDANGEIIEYVGTAVDVTERERLRQLETDLAHINRVSMMGELAASLAHDMKQPLTGAAMNANACARWLRRDPPDLREARDAASRMVSNVMRASDIIDRVRALYTRATPMQELVDLNEVIEDMIDLLHNTASRISVAIRTDLDPDLPGITADRVQLQQVLMNLMLNGIEAMKDTGGELGLTSRATRDGDVVISVSDAGIGLPQHESERIFEAFFTTKPQGSGMGLSISRRIIESHGGRLWASRNTGRGATFEFTLPTDGNRSQIGASVLENAQG
jgi:PAS domain S-box-containing protein